MESNSSSLQDDAWSFPEKKIAEIQILTVVMHAWSQVEHDIIYKNPHRILPNDTMIQMLDGVNGLSINSEIMLDKLRQTLDQAQKKAKLLDDKDFRSNRNRKRFQEILQDEYLEGNDDWEADPRCYPTSLVP